MEIRVTELNASDEITIRTLFSDYSFRVTEPFQGKGVLTGGRLRQGQEAIFVERIRRTKASTCLWDRLEPGDRAVFLIGGNNFKKLTTSTITEITLAQPSDVSPDDLSN